MQTSYCLSVEELDEKFLRSVKALFSRPGQQLEITISSTRNDTEYLLASEANRHHLEMALKDAASKENLVEMPPAKLQTLE
jgi:hypothetical protein